MRETKNPGCKTSMICHHNILTLILTKDWSVRRKQTIIPFTKDNVEINVHVTKKNAFNLCCHQKSRTLQCCFTTKEEFSNLFNLNERYIYKLVTDCFFLKWQARWSKWVLHHLSFNLVLSQWKASRSNIKWKPAQPVNFG